MAGSVAETMGEDFETTEPGASPVPGAGSVEQQDASIAQDAVAQDVLEGLPDAVIAESSAIDFGATDLGDSGSVYESGIVHGLVEPEVIEVELDDVENQAPNAAQSEREASISAIRETIPSASRSVPPMRPSMRAHSSSALPPPRKSRPSGLVPPAAPLPPPRDEASHWAEANHRLAMDRERAKYGTLAAKFSERERQLIDVEARLGRALSRVAELERSLQSSSVVSSEPADAPSAEVAVETVSSPVLDDSMSLDDSTSLDDSKSLSRENAAKPSETTPSDTTPRAKSAVRSELQQIEGIGPRVEAALRKQGITKLDQLASWSDADVKRFAKRTKISRSRIVKGRWVQRAREVLEATAAE